MRAAAAIIGANAAPKGAAQVPANVRSRHGMACPQCGQTETLTVQVACFATLSGRGLKRQRGQYWSELSDCLCPRCFHSGTVADFAVSMEAQPCQ